MGGSIYLGRRPADIDGVLRYGEDNALSLAWLDEDRRLAPWPAVPILHFATTPHRDATTILTPPTVMDLDDTTAKWGLTAFDVEGLRGRGVCWARLEVNGETVASGSIKIVSRWSDQPSAISIPAMPLVVGPPGAPGTGGSGSGFTITENDGDLIFTETGD